MLAHVMPSLPCGTFRNVMDLFAHSNISGLLAGSIDGEQFHSNPVSASVNFWVCYQKGEKLVNEKDRKWAAESP